MPLAGWIQLCIVAMKSQELLEDQELISAEFLGVLPSREGRHGGLRPQMLEVVDFH